MQSLLKQYENRRSIATAEFIAREKAHENIARFQRDRMRVRFAFIVGWEAVNQLEAAGVVIAGEISQVINGRDWIMFSLTDKSHAVQRRAFVYINVDKTWSTDSSGWDMEFNAWPAENLLDYIIQKLSLER